jgi:prepilin-type N-terminal cleavage/methylation domain-containing protein
MVEITTVKKMKAAEARIGEAGFSLVEMIVSIVIFLIVTGAIYSVLQVARQGSTTVNRSVELSKTVRVGMNLLGRDTYNAGYGYPLPETSTVVLPDNRITALLGIPNDSDTTRDTVPPIIAGNNITLNSFNTTANVRTDQVTLLFKDSTFNLVGADPEKRVSTPLSINAASTNGSGIDEIVPVSGSTTSCSVNDIYLIVGNTGSTLGLSTALEAPNKIQFANLDVLGFNQTGASGPLRGIVVPASLFRVKMVTYFVTADGILTRREYANAPVAAPPVAYVDEPLVYGVENFQIKYVMDDGSLNDNPSAGADGIVGNADDDEARLSNVRQIRFTIDVRSLEFEPGGSPVRTTMTSIFSTRNLGYDAN